MFLKWLQEKWIKNFNEKDGKESNFYQKWNDDKCRRKYK